MIRVAVSPVLTHVKEALEVQGMDVLDYDEDYISHGLNELSALVLSGQDSNFLGMQDISAAIPVISAEGRTAGEITELVKDKARHLGR